METPLGPAFGAFACLVALAFGTAGCATIDRKTFELNMTLSEHIFEPMGRAYRRVTPKPVRNAIRNTTDNVRYTETLANNFLQLKWERLPGDVGRILVNTIVGFVGLFDPATALGIPRHEEDFGQTLGVWGFPEGPYFNIPFAGPTTLRDVWEYPGAFATSVFSYVDVIFISLPFSTAAYLLERFDESRSLDSVRQSLDPYLFVKDAYRQRRRFLIHDGNPPRSDEEEAIDEGLEDLEGFEDLDEWSGLDAGAEGS